MYFKDESHNLKGSYSIRTNVALSIANKSVRCLLLSGTPALSRPFELYSQISAVKKNFISA